jgi:hypothetical protein
MAGIGKETYPDLTLSEAAAIVERVGRDSVRTATGLAAVMGLKSINSGYFYNKVSAMTKYYGLLERTKGDIALTSLGERIAHPLSVFDKRAALAESVGRVSILKALYGALGPNFHEADFKTKLKDVTQAPLADIERVSPQIERIYRDSIPYFGPESVGVAEQALGGGSSADGARIAVRAPDLGSAPLLGPEAGYRTFQGDGVYLRVKNDRDALEEAAGMLKGWLARQKKKGRGNDSSG